MLWLAPGFAASRERSGSCDKKRECAERLRTGMSAYKGQNFPTALQEFQAAYAIAPDPVLLLNLGRTYFRLDQPDKALEYYLRFEGAAPNLDEETTKSLERYKAEAREALAQKAPQPPPAPSPAPVPAAPPPPPPPTPVYKKWWFWTATGIAATSVVGLGLGLGLGLKRNEMEPFGDVIWR